MWLEWNIAVTDKMALFHFSLLQRNSIQIKLFEILSDLTEVESYLTFGGHTSSEFQAGHKGPADV